MARGTGEVSGGGEDRWAADPDPVEAAEDRRRRRDAIGSALQQSGGNQPAMPRAIVWGAWLLVVGLAVSVISGMIQDSADTQLGLVAWGVIQGIGGWVAIVGLVVLIVGLIRRARA